MNGMVNWKNINSSPIAALNRNRKLLDILCAKGNKADKGQRDLFVRSDSGVDKIGLYTASAQKTTGKVSDAIQDLINFEYLKGQRRRTCLSLEAWNNLIGIFRQSVLY